MLIYYKKKLPWLKKIIWVIGVLRRTVSDWHFNNLVRKPSSWLWRWPLLRLSKNATHKQQSFSGLQSLRWSFSIKVCYSWVQTILLKKKLVSKELTTVKLSSWKRNYKPGSSSVWPSLELCLKRHLYYHLTNVIWPASTSLIQNFPVSVPHQHRSTYSWEPKPFIHIKDIAWWLLYLKYENLSNK